MPEHARIIQNFPKDPLTSLPPLSPRPPEFTPCAHLTQERMDQLGLAAQVLLNNEMGLAWDKSEKGRFREDYFKPVVIPTIENTPWMHRQPPIPPGIHDEVIELIQAKVASGVYEPCNSSYQSKWSCVAKKDSTV
ncbi:hypothetical protein BV22DRAFT_1106780 [Leucogyrophana mollusca]|uniref:Uncharacterized protein n=1 Tax=Leucogyrophana mollusca TaxID=85980 RepID=A0ACB8B9P3_9AGAM|nr:hypothetical protein BV22DRAFT_1106780 [Leucogyrophana mollusca]